MDFRQKRSERTKSNKMIDLRIGMNAEWRANSRQKKQENEIWLAMTVLKSKIFSSL